MSKSKKIVLKFSDQSESDSDHEVKKEKEKIVINKKFDVDANKYNYISWNEKYDDQKISLRKLLTNKDWIEFMDIIKGEKYYKNIHKILENILIEEPTKSIVPYPELLFYPLNLLSPKDIKVFIFGQDPYPGSEEHHNEIVPQAMGASFSVPKNMARPVSLLNIYKNLESYGHITKIPEHGYLVSWMVQGVFMYNATLTTFLGLTNAHQRLWTSFTDSLIKYINEHCKNIVFILWGRDAANKEKYINTKKHSVIISSHPSPLAFNKTLSSSTSTTDHKAFKDIDHFGKANKYLKSHKREEINWNSINET